MSNTQHTNESLTVHFKVKDFNAWQTSYNGNEEESYVCRHHEK